MASSPLPAGLAELLAVLPDAAPVVEAAFEELARERCVLRARRGRRRRCTGAPNPAHTRN
jgi:hypothetical protein